MVRSLFSCGGNDFPDISLISDVFVSCFVSYLAIISSMIYQNIEDIFIRFLVKNKYPFCSVGVDYYENSWLKIYSHRY